MRKRRTYLTLATLLTLSGAAAAQLLPTLGSEIGQATAGVGLLCGVLVDTLSYTADRAGGLADGLARGRLARLDALVRANPQSLEFDARGDPAVRGELLALDATPAMLNAATGAGFAIVE